MNFLQLQDKILAFLHRPASEMRTVVKDEINAVLLHIQRLHEFKYTERLVEFTYPANTLQLKIDGACEGTPRNYLNFQLLANTGNNMGQVLRVKSYNTIIQRRLKYEKLRSSDNTGPYLDHSEFTSQSRNFDLFLVNDCVGLYPTPTEDKYILVNLNIWLPSLVDDTDTNFLTEIAYDYIVDATLSRLHFYLKDDARSEEIDKKLSLSFEALKLWDSQIRQTTDDE